MQLDADLSELHDDLSDRIGEVVAKAQAAAVRWRGATISPVPHRLEPFLHERLWYPLGAFVDDGADEHYGYDAAGEIVLLNRSIDEFGPSELVLRAPGVVVTALLKGGGDMRPWELVRHVFEDGRIVRSEYLEGEEHYHYSGDRLVAIDEFEDLWCTTTEPLNRREQVVDVGGRIEVGDGVLLRDDQVVWRANDTPWDDLLNGLVDELAARCVEAIAAWPQRDARPVDTLWLNNYTQHDIQALPHVGYADRSDRWEFYTGPNTMLVLDDDENTLLREGGLRGRDPELEVVEAVARRLAARDWSGILTTTDDFCVFVADEDVKQRGPDSLRRVNPPEIAARWLRE